MTKIILENINITPLIKAQAFLQAAIDEAKSQLEKAGAIQSFEMTYELAWKIIKRVLAYRGMDVASPREVFRAAAQEKLIDNPEVWFEFIHYRNLTVHVYNQAIASEVFSFLPMFSAEIIKLISKLEALC